MKPLISIIIPAYNAEKYINETLCSIVDQKSKKLEIIIVNDGSKDNTERIIKSFSKKYDYIKSFEINNSGAPYARNFGIDKSTGEYIWFFDSDDLMSKDILSYIESVLENRNPDLLIGRVSRLCNGETFLDEEINNLVRHFKGDELVFRIPPAPGNKIYKKEIIIKNKIYFENVKVGQDLSFYLKYILFSQYNLYIEEVMYIYRIVYGSISHSYDLRIYDICKVFDYIYNFYQYNDNKKLAEKYLPILEINHYKCQLSKLSKYNNDLQKSIKQYFKHHIQYKRFLYSKKNLKDSICFFQVLVTCFTKINCCGYIKGKLT